LQSGPHISLVSPTTDMASLDLDAEKTMASFYFASRRTQTFREGNDDSKEEKSSRYVEAPMNNIVIDEYYSRPVMSNR